MLLSLGVGYEPSTPTMVTRRGVAADSVATHARAVLAISEFFLEWQRLWRTSETIRETLPGGGSGRDVRLPIVHCHPDAPVGTRVSVSNGSGEAFARVSVQFPIIIGEPSSFATCPSWILSATVPEASDEGASRDGALIAALRVHARDARARLLVALDSAASLSPGSPFLTGQVVRFQSEQGDHAAAATTARACRAERWWCSALVGYSLARAGALVDAEVAFRAMEDAMSPAQRCEWREVTSLLGSTEPAARAKTTCAERDTTSAVLWWLSDPLYRTPGNERWVAHQTRRVDAALSGALDGDARYPWDAARGGDALKQLFVRYDRPTYAAWGGPTVDQGHSGYLVSRFSQPVAPYSTFEYSLDRVRLVPEWKAILSPFTSRANDWSLVRETDDGQADWRWWPVEHFRPARRLVQLPDGQTVVFRRQSHFILASAVELSHPLTRRTSAQFDVMLLSTTSRLKVDSLDQSVAAGGSTVVLRSIVADTPAVVAIEAIGLGANWLDARTRFGFRPPLPLSSMKPGEVAISDPALLDARDMADNVPVPDEALLDHLLGNLSLRRANRRLGVYWETYGIHARDTVTIVVTMTGDADVSGLRRLGMALNVASDPNRSLSIRWTEPSPQHHTRTLDGPVPVQLRSLILNIAQLAPGPYRLRISVERAGASVTFSERRVVLER